MCLFLNVCRYVCNYVLYVWMDECFDFIVYVKHFVAVCFNKCCTNKVIIIIFTSLLSVECVNNLCSFAAFVD